MNSHAGIFKGHQLDTCNERTLETNSNAFSTAGVHIRQKLDFITQFVQQYCVLLSPSAFAASYLHQSVSRLTIASLLTADKFFQKFKKISPS